MADTVSAEKRSWIMSRVKSSDTVPERLVRSLIFSLGLRFRKNQKGLPGHPDVVMAKLKTAVFVHGCFWHRHKNCRDNSNPSTNSAFWQAKFKRNVDRDERNKKDLRELGWRVIVVWECETRNLEKLERRLRRLLLGDSSKPGNAASRKLPFTRGEHLRAAESRASYGLAKKGKRPTKGSKSR